MPALLFFIPHSLPQLAVPADMRQNIIAHSNVAQIIPNLRLRRVHATPLWIEREGEGIQVRGNITGTAGIRVVTPRPPNICRALQHYKILITRLLQPYSYTQARETRSKYDDAHMARFFFFVGRLTWQNCLLWQIVRCHAVVAASKSLSHARFPPLAERPMIKRVYTMTEEYVKKCTTR